jgi:hypothetical protein
MKQSERLQRALERNLHELSRAIVERKAMVGIETAESSHGVDFFRIAYDAMFNDMIGHAIKVLDRNGQSTSFWYVYRCEQHGIDRYIKDKGYDINRYQNMADKLKKVRDKTHFHIDRDAVRRPDDIWNEANIKGSELKQVIEELWDILRHVFKERLSREFPVLSYNGHDATEIIRAAQKAGIVPG